MLRTFLCALAGFACAALPGRLHAQAWTLDGAVAPVLTNEFSALQGTSFVPLPGGDLLAYGYFTHANGVAAPRLVRLKANGTVDPTFASGLAETDSLISIAPLPGGRLVAAIYQINAPRVGIPREIIVDATTTAVPTTAVTTAIDTTAIAVVMPISTQRMIRLRADGRIDPTFTPLVTEGGIGYLAALPNGRVLVRGYFRSLGDVARNGLALLNSDGTIDSTFAPNLSSNSMSVIGAAPAPDGSLVISAVAFGGARGSIYYFVRLFADGNIDPRFAPPSTATTYHLISVQSDGSVLAGNGSLTRYSPTGAIDRTYSVQIPELKTVMRTSPLPNGRLAVEAFVGPRAGFSAPAVFVLNREGQVERDLRRVAGGGEGHNLAAAWSDGRLLVLQGPLVVSTSYPPWYYIAAAEDPSVVTATAATTLAKPSAGTSATSLIAPVNPGPTIYEPTLALSSVDAGSVAPLAVALTSRHAGSTTRIEIDNAGRALIAGNFTQVDGAGRSGLVRFLPSGAIDPAFAPAKSQLLFAAPDGRPIVSQTTVGPVNADGFHPLVTRVVRLQASGAIDPAFTFAPSLNANQTKWLTAAGDGRILVAAHEPDESREENLKLIWIGTDGQRASTLPAVFGGLYRSYPVPLAAIAATTTTTPPTTGPATTPIDPSIATATAPTIAPPTATETVSAAAIAAIAAGTAAGATTAVSSTPAENAAAAAAAVIANTTVTTTTIAPTVVYPPYYYPRPNPIDSVRLVAGDKLLVAGGFLRINGTTRPDLVRLNADGSLDRAYAFISTTTPIAPPVSAATTLLTPTAPATVTTPATATTATTVATATTATPATTAEPAQTVAVSTTPAVTLVSIFLPTTTTALPLRDGRALVFTSKYVTRGVEQTVTRLRTDGTPDPTFQPPPGLPANVLELADGSLFAGGAHYSADGALDRNFAPRLTSYGYNGYGYLAALDRAGRLWLGGNFDQVNGLLRGGLARFLSSEIIGITFGPRSQSVVAGRGAEFEVILGTNQSASYRWTRNGVAIDGATNAALRLGPLTAADAGDYRVVVTVAGRTVTSEAAVLTVAPNTARFVNFSARSRVDPGSPPQIAGFVSAPGPARTVLLRATGRGMPGGNNSTMLAVPVLTLYNGSKVLAEDRGGATTAPITTLARAVGAFPILATTFAPGAIAGSALTAPLGDGGNFTVSTTSGDGGAGVSLFELYDTGGTTAQPLIRNLAIRGMTASGANVLTAGFVIAGDGPLRVLVRGIGPTLASFGVAGIVADPELSVFSSSASQPIAANDNWDNDAGIAAISEAVRAFTLPRSGRDAALVLTLEPGAYTAQLAGVNNTSGTGLIEIYALDHP